MPSSGKKYRPMSFWICSNCGSHNTEANPVCIGTMINGAPCNTSSDYASEWYTTDETANRTLLNSVDSEGGIRPRQEEPTNSAIRPGVTQNDTFGSEEQAVDEPGVSEHDEELHSSGKSYGGTTNSEPSLPIRPASQSHRHLSERDDERAQQEQRAVLETVLQNPGYRGNTEKPVQKPTFDSYEEVVDGDTNETRSTIVRSTSDYVTSATTKTNQSSISRLAQITELASDLKREDDDVYSNAGSVADYEDDYANALRNELCQDLRSLDLRGTQAILPGLLEQFAIRIGHQGQSRDHRNMMYIALKHRGKIARDVCGQECSVSFAEDDTVSSSSDESDTDEPSTHRRDNADNFQEVRKSRQVVGREPLETYRAERDTMEDLWTSRHGSLRNSEAYKWLVASVHRHAKMGSDQPSIMTSHRKWFLNLLETHGVHRQRISRHKGPPVYTAKLELAWNLLAFLKQQEYDVESVHLLLGHIITLTGDNEFAQALPCQEYMQQIWPTTGPDLILLLERLAETPGKTHECVLSDRTRVSGELRQDSAYFEATGTKYGLAELIEQIFWVSTALETPTELPGVSLNFAIAEGVFSINRSLPPESKNNIHAQHVGTAVCKVRYESKFLDRVEQIANGKCWYNLFQHCAIVEGYPVPPRPSGQPGLEIPFDMMAALANAERVTPFCDNLLLKGFSTLLFPTHSEDECIYWHLVYNEDGSRVSFADKRASLPEEIESAMANLDVSHFNSARHFVGWAAVVKKNTGAVDARYNIGWSALKRPSQGFVLEKIQITAGRYVTVGSTFARGKREKAVHIKNPDDYIGRLKSMGDKFVVLHDIEVRKAWLVDGLSALLHLVRASMAYDHAEEDYRSASLVGSGALLSKGGYSGRMVAFDTLSDGANMRIRLSRKTGTVKEETEEQAGNDSDFYCVVDAVKDIMHILEQITDLQADERSENSVGYRIRTSPWSQLEGFDFMGVASKCDRLWPLAATLRADGEGWAGLTRAIHATTLFGKKFGDLLEPVFGVSAAGGLTSGRCDKCHWNSSVPPQRDVLAVPVSEIERMIERHGNKSASSLRLVEDFHLDIPQELFSPCSQGRLYCSYPQRIQNLRANSPNSNGKTRKRSWAVWSWFASDTAHELTDTVNESTATFLTMRNGAILLGMSPKHLRRRAPAAVDAVSRAWKSSEETSHQTVAVSSNDSNMQDNTTLAQFASTPATSLETPHSAPPGIVDKGRGIIRDDTSQTGVLPNQPYPARPPSSCQSSVSDDFHRRRRAARRLEAKRGDEGL